MDERFVDTVFKRKGVFYVNKSNATNRIYKSGIKKCRKIKNKYQTNILYLLDIITYFNIKKN